MSDRNKKLSFAVLFVALGLLAMQVPFTKLMGANISFSLFDFYGPIVGGFMGSTLGLLLVALMQLVNWAWHGFAMDAGTIIRFFPMLFAVLYFAKKSKWMLLIPAACMIAFWAHPEGRAAWYFALYWLIPIACYLAYDKLAPNRADWNGSGAGWIFARALGSTFTAHAVGGALWIWVFNMKAAIWISLIPVVWEERGLMAIGITLTYLVFNAIFAQSVKRGWLKVTWLKLHSAK